MEITVIIPTYNDATFLPDAIGSVLAQTHPVREVIVVDDGSTDNTREVAGEFGAPVRYFYKEKGGPGSARNFGARQAACPWLAFLDSDDWWAPNKIDRQLEAMARTPDAVLGYTSFIAVLPGGARRLYPACAPEDLWPMMRYRNPITGSASSVLMRKDLYFEVGGFREDLSACEDWDLWVRLGPGRKYTFVAEPVVYIRLTYTRRNDNIDRVIESTEAILETSLLTGLEGAARSRWRRYIRAAAFFRASQSCRAGSAEELRYLGRSLRQWPFSNFQPERGIAVVRNLIGPARYDRWRKLFRGGNSATGLEDYRLQGNNRE